MSRIPLRRRFVYGYIALIYAWDDLLYRLRLLRKRVPHYSKRRLVLQMAGRYGLRALIETGTYLGDMLMGTRHYFKELYSIELSEDLAAKAVRRVASCSNIVILQGNSCEQLPIAIERCGKPAIFWLDAHYSGGRTAGAALEVPITQEIEVILLNWRKGQVVLIDDARLFVGQDGYPTIAEITSMFSKQLNDVRVAIDRDVICITQD